MTTSNKGLGRGLNALFNNQSTEESQTEAQNAPLKFVPINDIVPNPEQPRKYFDDAAMQELATSIRAQGVLQPILLRAPNEDGKYEIIAGERRWRAAFLAGLTEVPAIIKQISSSATMLASLMENMQRENLNPLEEAQALGIIRDTLGLSQTELANAVGIQRSTISNMLRLLNLTDEAKEDLVAGRITSGHARTLLVLPKEAEAELRQRIKDANLSARAAEMALSYWQEHHKFPWSNDKQPRAYKKTSANIKRMAKEISYKYHCKANIHGNAINGKIAFTYKSADELRELLLKLGLPVEKIEELNSLQEMEQAEMPQGELMPPKEATSEG